MYLRLLSVNSVTSHVVRDDDSPDQLLDREASPASCSSSPPVDKQVQRLNEFLAHTLTSSDVSRTLPAASEGSPSPSKARTEEEDPTARNGS